MRELARSLLRARLDGCPVERPSDAGTRLGLGAAYRLAREVDAGLEARGWRPVGRKLGFTNRTTWAEFDLATPIWAPVWDRTCIDAEDGQVVFSLSGTVAPRIEPEIVVGLGEAGAVAWIAPGFEIVDCHYPDWRFDAAEIVADAGAHAALIVGPRVTTTGRDAAALETGLAQARVTLERDGEIVDRGRGENALGGPFAALRFLAEVLAGQPEAPPLRAGEIVTTGTLTGIPYVEAGQTWTARFEGQGLGCLTVRLG